MIHSTEKQNYFLNIVYYTSFFGLLIYAVFYCIYDFAEFLPVILIISGFLVLCVLGYLLLYRKSRFSLAKTYLLVLMGVTLYFIVYWGLGPEPGIQYYFLVFSIVPLMLYRFEKLYIWYIYFVLYLMLFVIAEFFRSPELALVDFPEEIILPYRIGAVVASVGLIGYAFWLFYKTNEGFEHTLLEHTEELSALNQKLEEANKSKDILFSVVSHDMKNPLTSVSGFIQLLKRDWETLSEEKKMEYFRLLDVSVENLTDLTEDLLQWSRAQSSKIVYEPRDILLKELANDIVQLYRPVAEKKGLQLEVEGEEQLLVSADINMLQTIFRNLISNAIKFSREGGSILTSIYKSGDKVCVAIKDQGVGIPEEKLNQLFHIDKTFTTPGTDGELGTGLGLVLVSEFMELNQGSIELESQEGQGTTFTLSFPASGDKS